MSAKKKAPENQWPNRIVDHGEEDPEQLLANPFNYRIHPKEQQDAMLGTIAEVGLIQSVIVNKRTGHLVDGHLRVILAMRAAQKKIPVVYVDLSEAEERKALASYDVLTGMVSIDKTMFAEMMADVEITDERFRALVDMTLKDFDGRKDVSFKVGGERCICPNCGSDHALRSGI